jgi:serine/tyrosine/threonine adenylyltransferase
MRLGLTHSYADLPPAFHTTEVPAVPGAPRLLAWNEALATELGLDAAALQPVAHELLSGRTLPEDARPIAMAYAGHQFAHFVPALGDGRAILLGEKRDANGVLRDLQLKGAGRTRWSRGGDGHAAVGPMLREYLVSEAMHALGIPTTRSLAVVATGDEVLRDTALPGAVLLRVAASHVRVGTFEYFAARGDVGLIDTLLRYCIARHYPEFVASERPALDFLRVVTARQAALIADWMSVGFIHGVMNTDNMAISGETIDYGPCAFMDEYNPDTVFSSIDRRGRYRFANQPAIAQWNLARLAECLLPLIDADPAAAVDAAGAILESFLTEFEAQRLARMRRKLGFTTAEEADARLAADLLEAMRAGNADFTLTFRLLGDSSDTGSEAPLRALFSDTTALDPWLAGWRARLAREPQSIGSRRAAMQRVSPAYIPRNHRLETALDAATHQGDLAPFETLLRLVQQPFDAHAESAEFQLPPQPEERVLHTFCGT